MPKVGEKRQSGAIKDTITQSRTPNLNFSDETVDTSYIYQADKPKMHQ